MGEFVDVGQAAAAVDAAGEGEVDQEDLGLTIIPDTLCMACGASGDTRMMTVKIPYFRELILASFECETCGETNNEVTFGGEIQVKGCRFELTVERREDLNRQLIKSDTASVRLPDLDFEIPARSQRGGISTVEGVLSTAAQNLRMYQAERMAQQPEVGAAVAQIITRLTMLATGLELPFGLVVDDPAGNSFIENKLAPAADPQLKVTHYTRTPTQDIAVGLQPSMEARETGVVDDANAAHGALPGEAVAGLSRMLDQFGVDPDRQTDPTPTAEDGSGDGGGGGGGGEQEEDGLTSSQLGRREIVRIPTPCPHCFVEGETLTCMADIPHFKEVIIMAFDCAECGYRSNEVKGGGGVPARGQETRLEVKSMDDFRRDVLKSDSAVVLIPEIELEAAQASLGGMYTTVEGLLKKVHETMVSSRPLIDGDSSQAEDEQQLDQWTLFVRRFKSVVEGRLFPFTLILRDPLANSFVGGLPWVPLDEDPSISVQDYTRSYDEDEEYGLHDINVERWNTPHANPDTIPEDEEVEGSAPPTTEQRAEAGQPAANPNLALTSQRWGPDHPHEYAKGCDDFTLEEQQRHQPATTTPTASAAAAVAAEVNSAEVGGEEGEGVAGAEAGAGAGAGAEGGAADGGEDEARPGVSLVAGWSAAPSAGVAVSGAAPGL